jgi:hypothetical protein
MRGCTPLRGAAANRWPALGGRRRYLRYLTFSFCLSAVPADLLLRERQSIVVQRSLAPRGEDAVGCGREVSWLVHAVAICGSLPAAKLEKAETRERREGEGEGEEQE